MGQFDDVQKIADEAIRRFGGFDNWVNNAGVSIYGPVLEQSLEDQRRLFDTNYWGVVHGSMVACEHLRKRGGALINVGSSFRCRHPDPGNLLRNEARRKVTPMRCVSSLKKRARRFQ